MRCAVSQSGAGKCGAAAAALSKDIAGAAEVLRQTADGTATLGAWSVRAMVSGSLLERKPCQRGDTAARPQPADTAHVTGATATPGGEGETAQGAADTARRQTANEWRVSNCDAEGRRRYGAGQGHTGQVEG